MLYKSKKILACLITVCFLFTQAFAAGPIFAPRAVLAADSTALADRISGDDRYKTAAAISQKGWEAADYAVLARGDNFADALCAGPLAYRYNGPILLTEPGSLNPDALAELKRLSVKHLFIAGGLGAVSQKVEDDLKLAGINSIERLCGDNRYETSAQIARKLGSGKRVVLATGSNFPDALSISVVASLLGMPILLTAKDTIPSEVREYFQDNQVSQTYLAGGTGAISYAVETQVPGALRLAGGDRYETNIAILKNFESEFDFEKIYVATGSQFADALTGTVLAAKNSAPLILTGYSLPSAAGSYLENKVVKLSKAIGLGGLAAVSSAVLNGIISIKSSSTTPTPIGGVSYDPGSSVLTTAAVRTAGELNTALANNNLNSITLAGDITGNVTVTRTGSNAITLNFGSYVLSGNLNLTANSAAGITLNGTAKPAIVGNLTVSASNATVTNGITVSGTITVADVGKHSWVEQADGNKITLTDDNGASIVIEGNPDDVVVEQTADGGISIIAKKPVKITVNAGANVESITATGEAAGTTITNNGTVASVTADTDVAIENTGTVANVSANADVTIKNDNNTDSGAINVTGSGTVGTSGTAAGKITTHPATTVVTGISSALGINPAELRIGSTTHANITIAGGLVIGEKLNVTSVDPAIIRVDNAAGLGITAVSPGRTAIKVQVLDTNDVLLKQGTISIPVLPPEIKAASVSLTAPVTGAIPQTAAQVQAATNSSDYSVTSVNWNEALTADGKFKPGQVYSATLVLTSKNQKAFQQSSFKPIVVGASSVGLTTTTGAGVGNRVAFTVTYQRTEDISTTVKVSGVAGLREALANQDVATIILADGRYVIEDENPYPGQQNLSVTLDLDRSVTVKAENARQATVAAEYIKIGADNVIVEGLVVESTTSQAIATVWGHPVANAQMINNQTNGNIGIQVKEGSSVTIKNNVVADGAGDRIWVEGAATVTVIAEGNSHEVVLHGGLGPDPSVINVTDDAGLTAALADPTKTIITLNGNFSTFTVNRAVTLTGNGTITGTVTINHSATIDGLSFDGGKIAIKGGESIIIKNCEFSGYVKSIVADGSNVSGSSITIDKNTFTGVDYAVYVDEGSISTITDNIVNGARKGLGVGKNTTATFTYNTLNNCTAAGIEYFLLKSVVNAAEIETANTFYFCNENVLVSISDDVVIIESAEELADAIAGQKAGDTWIIKPGTYVLNQTELDKYKSIKIRNEGDLYFPIVVDNLTIIGEESPGGESPYIYSSVVKANSLWCTQNLITVAGNGVTIDGLKVKCKDSPNKLIEILGQDFTLKNFESIAYGDFNDDGVVGDFGGSLLFNNSDSIGTVTLENIKIQAHISFKYAYNGGTVTFNGVEIDQRDGLLPRYGWSLIYTPIDPSSTITMSCVGTGLTILLDEAVNESVTETSTLAETLANIPSGSQIVLEGGTYCIPEELTVPRGVILDTQTNNALIFAADRIIQTATDLQKLATAVNTGTSFAGKKILLLNDIDLSDIEWIPIGNKSDEHPFSGVFDGNDKTISNLSIDLPVDSNYYGLFGYVSGATIKNIDFMGANVSGGFRLGVLCGYADASSMIEGITVDATSIVSNIKHAAGICGTSYGTIKNCTNRAIVSSDSEWGAAAGIVAWNEGTVEGCENTGTINSNLKHGSAGGIAGYAVGGMITNCSNFGMINAAEGVTHAYAGGIAAYTEDDVAITGCTNSGDVDADDSISNILAFKRCAGGIAGYNSAGTLTIQRCINTGDISGYNYAGGTIGLNGSGAYCDVSYSYNSGMIVSNYGKSDVESPSYASGLVGYTDNGMWGQQTVSYCLNAGSVTNNASNGEALQVAKNPTNSYYYSETTLYDTSGTAYDGTVTGLAGVLNTGLESGSEFWGVLDGVVKPL